MNKPAKKPPEEGAPEWMMTFGDLMSQLLTFFILLVSFSIFDDVKYNRVKGILDQSFGMLPAWDQPLVYRERVVPEQQRYNNEEERMRGIGYKLKVEMAQQGKGENVEVEMKKEGLLIRLKEDAYTPVFFPTGEDTLMPEAYPVLDAIIKEIKDLPNEIRVTGHTDSRPIHGGRFSSNWELSGARARSVQRYLIEHGIDENRTSYQAYAHTRPIADENTSDPVAREEAMQQNRRVDILIVRQYKAPVEEDSY
jgi:chemotaxis protein MotB